ncbi:MAG: insulinase family protein [Candidatus Gastranaerophilales bacterium]|nr:insulinase family protein [Candidatus Gastranaerophilales bacterium]
MKKTQLKNGIKVILNENKNTPRTAITFYLRIANPEIKAGTNILMNRLFLQGTKKRTAEQIANETEENAIELYSEIKTDYLRFKGLSLNEDFDYMLEILEDIMLHSTFKDLDKEVIKLKGEISADLDSPKAKASDAYYRTLYENHPYGNTSTKVLEDVDKITKKDIKSTYKNIMETSEKVISVAGDFDEKKLLKQLEKHFGKLKNNSNFVSAIKAPKLTKDKLKIIEKNDAKQAQIFEGWLFPTYSDKEYATICVINSILGASGLSSRLFLELREKQGLAYTVRSIYEIKAKTGAFTIYIGTEPKNIKTAIDGFKSEIEKIKTIPVDEKELQDAKNNVIGKRGFYFETNALISSVTGMYEIQELGCDYEQTFIENIKKVTSEDILKCAKKYFSKHKVLTVLAPKKNISKIKNEIL